MKEQRSRLFRFICASMILTVALSGATGIIEQGDNLALKALTGVWRGAAIAEAREASAPYESVLAKGVTFDEVHQKLEAQQQAWRTEVAAKLAKAEADQAAAEEAWAKREAEEARKAEEARLAEEARRAEAAAAEKRKTQTSSQPMTGVSTDELTLLAALIQCEAGGESYEGKVAVGAVVMNRVRSGSFANSITGVIYAPGQFGPVITGIINNVLAAGPRADCIQAAQDALNGSNPIGSCLYFNGGYGLGTIQIGAQSFW
ncbi:MAG: cell wall hydrolase [Lachnospiraceae bacterium]|nr:cell wall hydrolase [Lachnospiraceae bacterium]MDY5742559.1 cell wall hydrolase [Lachnospiraceae bacterium]